MKKENRKAAQERRAKEREAEQRKRKTIRILVPALIIAAIVVLVIGIVVSGRKASNHTSDSSSADSVQSTSVTGASDEAASVSTSATSSSEPVLDTEAGLTAKAGDKVNIDYVGKIDGKEFDGGSTNGQGTDLVLGSGTYIDNFEEQIEGHVTGETFDVTVTFPDDYGVTDLQGKEAVFTTTLNGIYR